MQKDQIVGLEKELYAFNQWINQPQGSIKLFSISGIGGIGKTTLLAEMAAIARQSLTLTVWIDGQSELPTSAALLTSMEMILAHEYGRHRNDGTPLLSFIIAELSQQKSVILLDHCEHLQTLESWLMTTLLPQLASADILFVFASRHGLSMKWRTNPYWSKHIQSFPLQLLSRQDIYAFLNRSDLPQDMQKHIAQHTEGHPLLLALTIDLLQKQENGIENSVFNIPQLLSTEFLKELTSAALYEALSALSLMPVADQHMINDLLDQPISSADFQALGSLSFVRSTTQGLSIHSMVARLLRQEWQQRHSSHYQLVRGKAFELLAQRYPLADHRLQMHIAAHVLELYREYLPSTHAYMNFSSKIDVGDMSPYQQDDLPYLQRFLATSLLRANWQSEVVHAPEYEALLLDIAQHCPEGILLIRDSQGVPLGFCAGVWLDAYTMPFILRYAPQMLQVLGHEAEQMKALAPGSADTICVFLAAVDVEHALYEPEELGAVLMQQWHISMTRGIRCIIVAGDPHLNMILPSFGYESKGTIGDLTYWELDFRKNTFSEWIHKIIQQTESLPTMLNSSAEVSPSKVAVTWKDAKYVLEHLYQPVKLEKSPLVQSAKLEGHALQQYIHQTLRAPAPPPPLTALELQILRESYLIKGRNKNELADAFHMSRTTFYRHTKSAMSHLAQLLEAYCQKA